MTSILDTRIETERLILRVPREEDFPSFCAFMGDEESARHIGGEMGPSQTWRGMAALAGSWALHGFGMFSFIEKESGEWIGRGGPWRPAGWPGSEVGWGIVRAKWGQGYAREAATACMDFAVDVLGWDDIIHSIDPANVNSENLAKRLGSVNRGPGQMPAPFEAMTVNLWGQSAAEWKARRS